MDAPTVPFIEPEVWGRSFWEFLDAIVATFPRDNPSPEHRNAAYDLLSGLAVLLPCPTCRKHYADFLQRHPLDHALLSRRDLVQFYFLLRNDVAGRTRKNMHAHNPDELWTSIVRRMKVATVSGARTALLATTPKQRFRVPSRVANVANGKGEPRKGCNCGGKK